MNPRYEFTGETKILECGTVVRQIRCLSMIPAFRDDDMPIPVGEIGGWIEGEHNLSLYTGHSWTTPKTIVWGRAKISGNARLLDNAMAFDHADIGDRARVSGDSKIYGPSTVRGNACVSGAVQVFGDSRIDRDAQISDMAIIASSSISDKATVMGNASVHNSMLRGNAAVSGDARVVGGSRMYDNSSCRANAHVDGVVMRENSHVGDHAVVRGQVLRDHTEVLQDAIRHTPVVLRGLHYMVTITDNHLMAGCQIHTFDEWRNFTEDEISAMDGKPARDFIGTLRTLMECVLAARK